MRAVLNDRRTDNNVCLIWKTAGDKTGIGLSPAFPISLSIDYEQMKHKQYAVKYFVDYNSVFEYNIKRDGQLYLSVRVLRQIISM